MDKIKDFKSVCFKLAAVMVAFYLSATFCMLLIAYVYENLADSLGISATYILRLVLSGIFLYGVPILSAMYIFGDYRIAGLYKKPPRLIKAVGNFPAMYGLGQLVNLVALLIVWLFSVFQAQRLEEEAIERSFGTMNSLIPPNMLCGFVLFIHMVFAAAIFEEFICRGVMLNALKPFGNGFAIIVTGFLFGIMHGNFQQFTYAFVLGIVLGYITIQTGSILAATILHALFNSIAAVMMLFFSTESMQNWLFRGDSSESAMGILAAFGIYFTFFIGLLIAGIALAVKRLTRLKSYKTVNDFTEISTAKKAAVFFTSVPAVIMIALAIDSFAGNLIAFKILDILLGG
jgi:hypothetical protein